MEPGDRRQRQTVMVYVTTADSKMSRNRDKAFSYRFYKGVTYHRLPGLINLYPWQTDS